MLCLFTILAGPGSFLPDSYILILIALAGQGYFVIVTNLPLLPLVQHEMCYEFGEEKAGELAETSASIYAIFGALGLMLGSLYSQLAFITIGFRATSEIMAFVIFSAFLIFGYFADGFKEVKYYLRGYKKEPVTVDGLFD